MEPNLIALYREALRLLDAAGNLPYSGEYNLMPIYEAGLISVRDEIRKLLKEYELSKSGNAFGKVYQGESIPYVYQVGEE